MVPDSADTPVTFSREEARKIRDSMATSGATVMCPRCGRELTLGKPIAQGGERGTVWHVRCDPCRRSAFVTEPAGGRGPEPPG